MDSRKVLPNKLKGRRDFSSVNTAPGPSCAGISKSQQPAAGCWHLFCKPKVPWSRQLLLLSLTVVVSCHRTEVSSRVEVASAKSTSREAKNLQGVVQTADTAPPQVSVTGSNTRQWVPPKTDAWEAERINEHVGEVFHEIADCLVGAQSTRSLAGRFDEGFKCTSLRPQHREQAFADAAFVIERGRAGTSRTADYKGFNGFLAALAELASGYSTIEDAHAKFKTIRVDSRENSIETVSYYEFGGAFGNRRFQQKATWTCTWTQDTHGDLKLCFISVDGYEESLGAVCGMFADCTESILEGNTCFREQLVQGLDYWLNRIERVYGILPSGWIGASVGDVNNDGLEDLYLSQPGGLPNRLFVQQPDGTLKDISREARVDWWDYTHASLFLDLDNDGDQDLVLATALGLLFMENDGVARFRVAASKLTPEARSVSISAADYDTDGDLDIYAGCYSLRGNAVARSHGLLGRPIPYHDANNGGRNILFRNEGHWEFRDVTKQVGMDTNNRRFTLASAWEDFNNDGLIDLYVANDFGRNNLFRNDGGTFTDVAPTAGVEDISAGMSVSWGDFDHDGWMDLYVANMFSSAGNRITYQRKFMPNANATNKSQFQRHARGNSLFRNLGNGEFADVSVTASVTMGRWAWSSMFTDINNDSFDDLIVANGFLTREDPGDL